MVKKVKVLKIRIIIVTMKFKSKKTCNTHLKINILRECWSNNKIAKQFTEMHINVWEHVTEY